MSGLGKELHGEVANALAKAERQREVEVGIQRFRTALDAVLQDGISTVFQVRVGGAVVVAQLERSGAEKK